MRFILNSKQVINELINKLLQLNPGTEQPVFEADIKECKANRSLAQNRLLWLFLGQLSKDYNLTRGKQHSPETWNVYFKSQFLDSEIVEIRGEVIKKVKSTTKLNTKTFTDYLERIDFYCADELGIKLQHPDDMYWEAMGLKQ